MRLNEFGLMYWAGVSPDREAVYDCRYRLSYAQLADRVMALATFLADNGISYQDRILVCLPNCCEMVTLFFASVYMGAVMVPCNVQYKEHELQHVVDMAKPKLAVFPQDKQIGSIFRIPDDMKILRLDISGKEDAFKKYVSPSSGIDFSRVKPENSALIVCTSGSTCKPKGAELTCENLLIPAQDIAERFHMTEADVSFVPVPLCHMFGIMGVVVAIYSGGRIVLTQKFNAEAALSLLEQEKVTLQYCVAAMYELEIEQYEALEKKPDLENLRTGMIAGAPSIRKCIVWFEEKLRCRLLNAYGMTEVSALIMADLNDSQKVRYEMVGKPCSHARVAIISEDETLAAADETGEIVCKSPGIMRGYTGHLDETVRCYTKDGWFKTGDIGKYDADGNFTITGRKKDLIIRGGYNIVPSEIEGIYLENESVAEVCVLGYQDEILGERIAAFLVMKKGLDYSPEELRQYAKERISKYKVPDKVIILNALPRLSNGKYDKVKMKKIVAC